MRAIVLFLVLGAQIAAAEPAKPESKPQAACKRVVVGKGLDRHVTCEISAPIVISTSAPKPGVLIVPVDGKKVVGRPQASDRFAGLSHQLH